MDSHGGQPVATIGISDAVLSAFRQILGDAELAEDDDFFEAGGDSVQVLKTTELILEMTGVEVSLGLFFTYPTAGELAAAILESEAD
jgi:acyl carrier protein